MQGSISAFRGTFRRKSPNHMIVVVDSVDSHEKAKSLVGKNALWRTPGKKNTQIKGVVAATHGRNGAVRVIFERGMPGQSLGTEVTIE